MPCPCSPAAAPAQPGSCAVPRQPDSSAGIPTKGLSVASVRTEIVLKRDSKEGALGRDSEMMQAYGTKEEED